MKRELDIVADKELEYAHQGYYKTKEIKVLRERVEHLEKQQAVNVERFKHRTKELKATVSEDRSRRSSSSSSSGGVDGVTLCFVLLTKTRHTLSIIFQKYFFILF